MATQPVSIVGVGMVTAVGLSAAETATSVRAGIMRFGETPIRDHRFEPFTLAEVPDDLLPPLTDDLASASGMTSRERRMLRLATPALAEVLAALPSPDLRPVLKLALPDTETMLPLDGAAFLGWLEAQSGGAFDAGSSDASFAGRAGGLLAIREAAALVASRQADFAIAGGVDTFRDLYVLGTLDMEKRVKSAVHLDGFIPGEGAGFLLLARPGPAERAGLTTLATITGSAHGFEDGHLYSEVPYRGDGLAAVFKKLFDAGAAAEPVQEVYSSMNGENHWAKEWGVSYIRHAPAFLEEHRIHHPADCYGDTGAACGPLMVGLAAIGIQRGYRAAPALVYGSSDRGERAAVIVGAP